MSGVAVVILTEEERDVIAGYFSSDWPMHLVTLGDVASNFAGTEEETRAKATTLLRKLDILGLVLSRGGDE